MNSYWQAYWEMMDPYLPILAIVVFAFFGLVAWFAEDMRWLLKSGQRKQRLSIDGDWKGLENYYERAARTRRPFAWLHQRYLIPGNLETQHALFLFDQGRLEEALTKADEAIRRNKSKPWIFQSFHSRVTFNTLCGALRTRILILAGLGRYDEARATAAELQKRTGPQGKPNAALALLEYYCGNIDEAVKLAQAVRPEDSQFDAMRTIIAFCHLMKRDFEKAFQALSFTPADITKFYSPSGLQTMARGAEASELLELQRRNLTGIFPPLRLIVLAQVYVVMEDFVNADRMLEQAEKSMGPKPGVQASYCRQRTLSFAGQGNSVEAEKYLERLRAIVKECPRRSLLWETHVTAGRAYLCLKRFKEALAELSEAQRSVLHPIEKHSTAYWMAKSHEAAGNHNEAGRYYEMVAADLIPSWMREQAAEALMAQKS